MALIGTNINDSPVIVGTMNAATTGARFKAVKFNSSGKIVVCSTAGEAALGILISQGEADVAASEEVTVQIKDIAFGTAGAAVAAGDLVATDADGKLQKAVGTTASQYIVGMALTAASAAGKIIQVNLTAGGGYLPKA